MDSGSYKNNESLERENSRLTQQVLSLQTQLERVKKLVLSPANQGDVIVRQEMEINRLREELDEKARQIHIMERVMARNESELKDYKQRELKWAVRHRVDGRKSAELFKQNRDLAKLAGDRMQRDEIREGVEVLTGLRNSPSPSPPKIGVAPKPKPKPMYDDPGLQKVHEEWEMDDAKPYVNPEDRKKIRAGVVATGPVQAQSPKKPSPKRGRPPKRKPSKKLNLEEPKRQEIELDKKYKVGDNVEVVVYSWYNNIEEDTLKTFDADVLRVPHKKDGNFRGIPVLSGYYVVQFQDRRGTIAPALGSVPSELKKGDSVYVIKGKFEEGYGSVKLEKKLSEKMEQSLRF